MNGVWIRVLFVIAGLYDGILGAAFLILPGRIFAMFAVPPPNHFGYVRFPALLLLVFAAMFFRIAGDPVGQRGLIPYGMALKVAYCGTVFSYALTTGVPSMWIPWAWADLAFLICFFAAWRVAGTGAAQRAA